MSRDGSVIVAGGGPAGSAAAIALAKSGRKVLLVDDSAPRAFRVGQGLSPTGLASPTRAPPATTGSRARDGGRSAMRTSRSTRSPHKGS